MILALYRRLREIALSEFGDVVIGAEVIVSHTGRAKKLRIALIDDTFVDVWYSEARDYAYQVKGQGWLSSQSASARVRAQES